MARYGVMAMMLALALTGCATSSDVFPDIGDNVAAPSAIGIDVASNRLYLVNANSKVLYDSTQGNFQVYDLTNPLAPTIIDTVQTLSFSGQLYLDPVAKIAWTPNRYTANSQVTTGVLYGINIDEASADFLGISETTIDANAFSMQCCYPASRAWLANSATTAAQELQYADLGAGTATIGAIPLTMTLDTGGQITQTQASYGVIIGTQAFLSRIYGGIMVVNLDEAGAASAAPVDYFIQDIEAPYGLATDGTLLYVAGQGNNASGDWTNYLLIIDPSTLTPTTANTTTAVIDKENDGILLAMVTVGNNPMEVALSTQYAFVSNANDDTVSVIDVATRALVTTIAVGDEPVTMALYRTLAGVDQYLYVANIAADTLSVIDIPSLAVVATTL